MTETYPIPDAALDDRLAWTGTSGSGKTYNTGAERVSNILTVGQLIDYVAEVMGVAAVAA